MAPYVHAASPDAGNDVISRIYLIRHGDRFDYANPSWLESAKDHGALVTDPPLSALGHRQARETADQLRRITKTNDNENGDTNSQQQHHNHHVDKILVSPYLRVIQTACPTSDALGLPLSIENGLSEAHATPGVLPSPADRFAYFPHIDPGHVSLYDVQSTPGHSCPKTGHACEAFAGKYCQRMEQFATCLERTYYGKSVMLFSHAASVALVAALVKCSMRDLKFAPCGIYQLQRVNEGPWTLMGNGDSNEEYVTENSPTTYPWGFGDKYFIEGTERNYWGSSEGIGLDYFVREES
mmetsp:Transcript_4502/g.10078  ORF Transcript_4502/g.10078 Transcript_4502/m.10078 type:complete len:296 (-) Transcript_4502:341-1228(-)